MSLSNRSHPSTVGDTYADVVVWKWDRSKMRWRTELRDGTVITISFDRIRRRALWRYQIDDGLSYPSSAKFYNTANEAEAAALVEYEERKKYR
jgi:hypothetical protein